jgi:ComF family protein
VTCGRIIRARREEICPECVKTLKRAAAGAKRVDFTEGCVCAFAYEGAVQTAFLRYKFSGQQWLGEVFGEYIAEAVRESAVGVFDAVTWAPLGKKRLRTRGYDQAKILAQTVGRELGLEVLPSLRKARETRANSSLSGGKSARRENVDGVYETLAGIEGKRLLLVDDILTTGATMAECARTLLLGGAESVFGAAFAAAGD